MNMRVLAAVAAAALMTTPVVAQTQFSWRAGDSSHTRAERMAERLEQNAERMARRMAAAAERAALRMQRAAERARVRMERQTNRTVNRLHAHITQHLFPLSIAGRAASSWGVEVQAGAFDSDPCANAGRRDHDDDYTHCEVRDEQLPAGALTVDARPNGGIRVEAWDGSDIRIRAIVQAHASTQEQAKALASRVQVQAGNGRVSASGPDQAERGRREWWSVGYRINVPRRTDLDLNSVNGSISIVGVSGTQRFDTQNGAVTLRDLGGSVHGQTRNGGLNVSLAGARWDGAGLDVATSNGGVTIAIPDGYNGQLETRTINGGVRFDYPMTVVGDLTARDGLSATLGSGGPTVRARTHNGRLSIERR